MSMPTSFPGTIEFTPAFRPRPGTTRVVFDFDGTLSLIRGGWAEVMLELYREFLAPGPAETEADCNDRLRGEILRLNGKPTIHQMHRLVELRGQPAGGPSADELHAEFQARLGRLIARRVEQIRQSPAQRERLLVAGARAFLEALAERGLTLYLVSGTARDCLLAEAGHLAIDHYFTGGIFGPTPEDPNFTKRRILERVVLGDGVAPGQFLSFGDGVVEIQDTQELGGLAVAVASDEADPGSGRTDAGKRAHLLAAGAHAVIPDYRDAPALLARLFAG